jgi:hypothetical protein
MGLEGTEQMNKTLGAQKDEIEDLEDRIEQGWIVKKRFREKAKSDTGMNEDAFERLLVCLVVSTL